MPPSALTDPVEPAARPLPERSRVQAIDVLRGLAILGILFVNMRHFTMPVAVSEHPHGLRELPFPDQLAWVFVELFCRSKFISLFSLLFGVGFAVQLARAAERGQDLAPRYLRRLAVLALFGLLHALLLWYGDILFMYAIAGLVLLAVRNLPPRALLSLAAAALLLAAVLSTACAASLLAAPPTDPAAQVAQVAPSQPHDLPPLGPAAIAKSQGNPTDPVFIHAETVAYREGPYLHAVLFRAVTWGLSLVNYAFLFAWHVLAMFLLGMALWKYHVFTRPDPVLLRRLLYLGAAGLLLETLVVLVRYDSGPEATLADIAVAPLHTLGAVLLMLGYVGAVLRLVPPRPHHASNPDTLPPVHPPERPREPVEASHRPDPVPPRPRSHVLRSLLAGTGRMALTAYLLESLLASLLAQHWGFARFGRVSLAHQFVFTLAIYLPIALLCVLWLRLFRFGPFEWLWRTLTYARPQPLLRRET